MTYKVLIEEVVSETFEIEADNIDEACEKAYEGYRSGELVLEPGNLCSAKYQILDIDTDEELTDFYDIY